MDRLRIVQMLLLMTTLLVLSSVFQIQVYRQIQRIKSTAVLLVDLLLDILQRHTTHTADRIREVCLNDFL